MLSWQNICSPQIIPELLCQCRFSAATSTGSVTERYAKFAPDYMGNARIAIDEYFIELQPLVERTLIFKNDLRVNCVLVGD